MNQVFKTIKTATYEDTIIDLGNFSEYFILKIDIEIVDGFNNSTISLGTVSDPTFILDTYNITGQTNPISIEGIGVEAQNLILSIDGLSTQGSINIIIYYLYSTSFINKIITYQDFINLTYDIGQVSGLNRVSDFFIKVNNIFDKGKIALKQGNTMIIENDKVNLTTLSHYDFEYHQEHDSTLPFTLQFEEFPNYGSFTLTMIYFPIKG
jgi:hypothetical protein